MASLRVVCRFCCFVHVRVLFFPPKWESVVLVTLQGVDQDSWDLVCSFKGHCNDQKQSHLD